MNLRIENLQDELRARYHLLRLKQTKAAKAFPILGKRSEYSTLAMPIAVLQGLLEWMWLQFHAGEHYAKVVSAARIVTERSREAAGIVDDDPLREQHDVFLLLAAILSGDIELMINSATFAISANPKSQARQFYKAWVGILKFHILCDRKAEREKFAIFNRTPNGLGVLSDPARSTVSSFCDRDYPIFRREINRVIQRCWKEARELGAAAPVSDEVMRRMR